MNFKALNVLFLSVLVSVFVIEKINSQDAKPMVKAMDTMEKEILSMENDSMANSMNSCCADCYKPILEVGARYYTDAMTNTRMTLANNGFILDQEAIEYQLRIYNLPKIFFYNQTGTLQSSRYASVIGFGIKEQLKYNVIKNSNFIVEPYLEAGLGYFQLNIVEGIGGNSISSVLTQDLKSLSLGNFTVSGDMGLSIGGRFNIGNARFTMLGQAGYLVNFPTQWRVGSSLAFREKINIGSPYFGATVKLDLSCGGNSCCSGMACCK